MKVSVFIPTYNAASCIEKTLRSVLEQTYSNLEVWIVDDCSTDNTCEILQAQAEQDSRVKLLFKEKNEGFVPYSWNRVFPVLNGEFTFYMSHDDQISPDCIERLVRTQEETNAGFFPKDVELARMFFERNINDMREVDILGSWLYAEKHFEKYMINCKKKINLASFYKPLFWENPWTSYLEGKKVLIIHPFTESIKYQYENNREKLYKNPNVLPKFKELILIQAVQSIADEKDLPFANWFDALEYMERQILEKDFDIALIGCGAYGLPLAAHVKRMGKQAVHMASWTQMLFGIYGTRWEHDFFINEHWIRPSDNERPKGLEKVENGCYW